MKYLTLSLALAAATLFAQDEGKNVYDVAFRSLPADVTALPAAEPETWNFNFRPYGDSGMLWSDPILQRDATSGGDAGEKPATAINVTCDADGFTLLFLCVEPALATSFAATNAFPSPKIEFFFTPGDADTSKIEHYYQMYYTNDRLSEFPWLTVGRDFRPCLPYTTHREYVTKNAVLVRIAVSWVPLFDRLPLFPSKPDNFWRLSVIRWGKVNQTWGGVVHQANQAGYIRWPAFTDDQKTAIMKGLLRKAWSVFLKQADEPDYKTARDGRGVNPIQTLYREAENKADPRSYVNYNEDAGFRPVLERLVDERKALAPTIGAFETLPMAEREAFYKKASDMLFNFRYDVEEAYEKYLADKMFD